MSEQTQEKQAEKIDETVPGGRYVDPDGVTRNAHGKPLGKGVQAEEPQSAPEPKAEAKAEPKATTAGRKAGK